MVCVTFVELHYHQQLGLISSETFLFAVDDPRPNIGSGSAVLNALLCVSEHLAARSGYTVCIFIIVMCACVCMPLVYLCMGVRVCDYVCTWGCSFFLCVNACIHEVHPYHYDGKNPKFRIALYKHVNFLLSLSAL